MLDGGEIKVFAPFSDQAVDNFEDSGHRKFNPTFGELVAIKAFETMTLAQVIARNNLVGVPGAKLTIRCRSAIAASMKLPRGSSPTTPAMATRSPRRAAPQAKITDELPMHEDVA